MKKTFRTFTILIFAVLMLLTSCLDKLQRMDDGSVNEYIYPYINFELAEDRTSVKAELLAIGNKPVKIPESALYGDKDLPVNSLRVTDGIKEIPEGSLSNVTSVKQIELPDSIEKIGRNSLPSTVEHLVVPESRIDDLPAAFPEGNRLAELTVRGSGATVGNLDLSNFGSLDKVNIERPETSEPTVWPEMKPLEKEGYVFLGWYTENGTRITAGMSIEKGQEQACPRWERKEEQAGGDFKVKIAYSYANSEDVVLKVTAPEPDDPGKIKIIAELAYPEGSPAIEWQLNGKVLVAQTGLTVEVEFSGPGTHQISAYIYDSNGNITAYAEAVITY